MHSSNKRAAAVVLLFLLIAGILLAFLDLALYPCTFMRNDIHAVTTEKQDLVILGTSNGKMDLEPDIILQNMAGDNAGAIGHNLCVGGEYPVDAYYLTQLMTEKNKPKQIIFEVDPGYFSTVKEPGNNYLLFYHEFPLSAAKFNYFVETISSCNIRTGIFQAYEYSLTYEIPRISETLNRKLSDNYDVSYFKGTVQEYHENGFIEKYPVAEENFPSWDGFNFEGDQENLDTNIKYLTQLISYCKREGIEFKATVMPLPDMTLQQDTEQFRKAWDYFAEYFDAQGVKFYNFNTDYYDAYPHGAEHFVDYDGHMNGESAREFSAVFGQTIN